MPPIKAGSPEARARALKAAETRRRNSKSKNGGKGTKHMENMEKQPFNPAYPHLEGAHVDITYGEYAGRSGIVKSTTPMVHKVTKDNPWQLRVRLDGNFKSEGAALVYVPQTYLRRSSRQLQADEKDRKWREEFKKRPHAPMKPFSEYVKEERARLRRENKK